MNSSIAEEREWMNVWRYFKSRGLEHFSIYYLSAVNLQRFHRSLSAYDECKENWIISFQRFEKFAFGDVPSETLMTFWRVPGATNEMKLTDIQQNFKFSSSGTTWIVRLIRPRCRRIIACHIECQLWSLFPYPIETWEVPHVSIRRGENKRKWKMQTNRPSEKIRFSLLSWHSFEF